MSTYKSIARRGSLLGTAFALVAATIPSSAVFADALNPLTERSLLLSSSAPGFQDSDGSGNSAGSPNAIGENYAPAGSGPNGKRSGQTFDFKVSSSANIQAFTLQYCTSAAGNCQAPGDNNEMTPGNAGDFRNGVYDSATNDTGRPTNAQAHPNELSDLDVVGSWTQGTGAGQFQVYIDGVASPETWTMTTANDEDTAHSDELTGKNNFITLSSATGDQINAQQQVQIVFTASESVHITNPGSRSFFVKMNTYSDAAASAYVNGGVTVANVMTDSIHITTKVLETMSFSVGTQNPDTQPVQHGSCDAIDVINSNRLNLGNPDAEFSLETGAAWDVNSYWRLSSNSSGGATVYYSGDTLRNTVGDHIADMPTRAFSQPGTEQFGLALVDAGTNTGDDTIDTVNTFPANWVTPDVAPLVIEAPYTGGDVASISDETSANNAEFAFMETSQLVPEVIAQNSDEVISCATSKVRYVGNIAADTPAGVYTTKINYLAAPQY